MTQLYGSRCFLRQTIHYVMLALGLSCIAPTYAAAPTSAETLQATLNKIHTMKAHFTQIVYQGKRKIQTTKGTMAWLKPDRFRWEAHSPNQELLIADGEQLWIYEKDLQQVTVKPLSKIRGTPGAVFLGGHFNTIAAHYTITSQQKKHNIIYHLQAKDEDEDFSTLTLTFHDLYLLTMQFSDQLGHRSVIQFTQIHVNSHLSTHYFTFKPPAGVDILMQMS